MNKIAKILSSAALLSALALSGCSSAAFSKDTSGNGREFADVTDDVDSTDESLLTPVTPEEDGEDEGSQESGGEENAAGSVGGAGTGSAEKEPEKETVAPEPQTATVSYIKVTGDGVNIRKGAGTSYASVGVAEKDTLYALLASSNGWYKTYYKNTAVYISAKYCEIVEIESSENDDIESVIAEGTRYMGVTYVYGATRYHDGTGKLLSGFTNTAFDCSSLMQYIFKKGAGINLQVNTRTQVYQGETVSKASLKRGDLIFFTNDSRKNNTGVERIGHVALYLGDNLILHTASDYAKIEEISSKRWSYYIQAQRMI